MDIILALPDHVKLIAVSKMQDENTILRLYNRGQLDFAENRVQELIRKKEQLPQDIRWHLIGHLQKNKVKFISHFIHLIHSVDSPELLETIDKEAARAERTINVLFQIKIAQEESKYGLNWKQANDLLKDYFEGCFPHVQLKGFMGMASFTEDMDQVRGEFRSLKNYRDSCIDHFGQIEAFEILSMGMSGDYKIAIQEGANYVRIGSLIFGERS